MGDSFRKLCIGLAVLLVCGSNNLPEVQAQASQIKVALYIGRGVSAPAKKNLTRDLDNADDISWKSVDGDDISNGALTDVDALVVPGGSALKEAQSMGADARERVRRFVEKGGIYVGICAGAYLSSQAKDSDLGLLPLKTLDQEHWFRTADGTPVDVELTPLGMDVFGRKTSNVRILYENGPIFGPPTKRPDSSFSPLGFYRSEVVAAGGERGVMLGAPAMVFSRYGLGLVLAISPHPEKTPGLHEMEPNALRWLYAHRTMQAASKRLPTRRSETSSSQMDMEAHSERVSASLPATPSGNEGRDQRQSPSANERTSLGDRALRFAESIFDNATDVAYVHHEVPAARQVSTAPDGSMTARTDCSGFISYIVHSIAPRHYVSVREREPDASYPQAKIWASFFDTLDSSQPTNGWLGITDWRNLQPGDLIAWKEGSAEARNTGHVMMVLRPPSGIRQEDGYRFIEIPVIDSSSVYHFSPERLPPNASQTHRNGLGEGNIRLILSANDEPIGYWAGTYWGEGDKPINGPTSSKLIRFARMVSLVH